VFEYSVFFANAVKIMPRSQSYYFSICSYNASVAVGYSVSSKWTEILLFMKTH
jgi:hypothetical protein